MVELMELLELLTGDDHVTNFISCVYGNTQQAQEMLEDYLFFLTGYRDLEQFKESEGF